MSWLLPASLVLLVVGLWLTRASLILWGAWTVVTALVFSLAEGVFHAYYTVALAPGIAALVGIGGHELWRHRRSWVGRSTLAVLVAGTAGWAWVLLGRSAEFLPWLRWVVVAVAVLAMLVQAGGRRWAVAAAIAVVLTAVVAPTAYAMQTAVTPHTGSIPMAGPSTGTEGFALDGGRQIGRPFGRAPVAPSG